VLQVDPFQVSIAVQRQILGIVIKVDEADFHGSLQKSSSKMTVTGQARKR
jgi:hypothetical protein